MLKGSFVCICVVIISCIIATASYSEQYWAKTYGGGNNEYFRSIQQTTDGGYVLAVSTSSFGDGSGDFCVLKLDIEGNISWQKIYGGATSDRANTIEQTSDGGYIVAGSSFSGSYSEIFLLKLSYNGNIEWQKTYADSPLDSAYSIKQTLDGGYIVAGLSFLYDGYQSGTDTPWVLKLNSDGSIQWQKLYSISLTLDSVLTSIQQTSDEGYILAGYRGRYGGDIWVLKLNNNGDVLWEKTYGGNSQDEAHSIQQTTDGGYIVAGYTRSFGAGNYDIWALKLASDGNIIWQKTYGSIHNDYCYMLTQTTDGGYILAGQRDFYGALLLKLNSNGDMAWLKSYGSQESDSTATSIEQISDDNYIVAGEILTEERRYDIFALKLDSNGEIPECDIMTTPAFFYANDTSISGNDTAVTIYSYSVMMSDATVSASDISAEMSVICCYDADDYDCDSVVNATDNCREQPNGPNLGTCLGNRMGKTCLNNEQCNNVGFCSMNQEDTYPPQGNGIGDACECEGDFTCDGDVDADDVTAFLSRLR